MTGRRYRYLYLWIVVCWATALASSSVFVNAQTVADASSTPLPTAEVIRQRIQEFENKADLSETQRAEIVSLYNQALTEWPAGASHVERRDAYTQSIGSVDQQLQAAQTELRSLNRTPTIDPTEKSLEELTAEVRNTLLEVQKAESELDQLNDQPQKRNERRLEIPKLLASLRNKITELSQKADVPGDSSELTAAKKLLSQIRQDNAKKEIAALEQELAYYDASKDLLPVQIDIAKRRVDLLNQELRRWQNAEADRQDSDVKKELREALEKEGSVPEELKPIAKKNIEYIEEWSKQAESITTTDAEIRKVNKLRADWDERFAKARAMIVSQGGVTSTVGAILRNQSRELPELRKLRLKRTRNQKLLAEVRDRIFKFGEELSELADLDQSVQDELNSLEPPPSAERRKSLESATKALLEQRTTILQGIRSVEDTQLQRSLDLALAQDTLVGVVEGYKTFIDERLLWIPSSQPVSLSDLKSAGEAVMSALDWQTWRKVLESVPRNLLDRPFPQSLWLAIAFVLYWYRRRMAAGISKLGRQARGRICTRFELTPRALLLTLLRALDLPLLMIWLSVNLQATDDSTALMRADPISEALRVAAEIYLQLALWYGLVRLDGVCDAHFDWSDQVRKVSRQHLRWFTPVIVICWSLHVFYAAADDPIREQSIGRFALVIGLLALAVFLFKVLSPRKGVLTVYLQRHSAGWLNRSKRLWFPLLIALPVAFAGLAIVGYSYTAAQLTNHLIDSFFFLGALLVADSTALRWIKLNRRKLAMGQAKERLAAMAQASDDDEEVVERTGGVVESAVVDLSVVNEQTERLLRNFVAVAALLGLYLIWYSIFPALAKLDEVRLWQTSIQVVPQADATATTAQAAVTTTQWITLSNVLGALLVLFLTLVATKNIPGLLEISILQRLPLDAALRYALTTVTRYGIIIGGLAITFSSLGFGWQKIQWLAAAVSVGLGFGLQEIFANFVSGLILLFERPLRAGDIVTVGDVTGKVVQIKMRATTIQDWDRKELVVPNKEFITGRLLNWTLTDTTNRLVISIGVAYGSDPGQTRQILLDVAKDHPAILDTPAPSVTFDTFGDSALNFTMRLFLPSMDDRLKVTTELHEAIYKRLNEAGIEIPFPQRDVHIRASDGSAPASIKS